jgi:hypothetical protein
MQGDSLTKKTGFQKIEANWKFCHEIGRVNPLCTRFSDFIYGTNDLPYIFFSLIFGLKILIFLKTTSIKIRPFKNLNPKISPMSEISPLKSSMREKEKVLH